MRGAVAAWQWFFGLTDRAVRDGGGLDSVCFVNMGETATKREDQGQTIELKVALHSDLRKYLPKGDTGAKTVRLKSGATVLDLMAELGIPDSEIVTIGIDGELGQKDSVLHDHADVTMFTPMEGG